MNSTDKKIISMFVLEIIGKPAEFLTETLKDIIKKIGEEKGVKINSTKINEPVLMKDQQDFYTSFAEVEIETENILYLAIMLFKYMPAYVEIISPQNISLTNSDVNDVFNELTRRLHGYEEIARILQNEKAILENRLREAMEMKENKKEFEKEKPKTVKRK